MSGVFYTKRGLDCRTLGSRGAPHIYVSYKRDHTPPLREGRLRNKYERERRGKYESRLIPHKALNVTV